MAYGQGDGRNHCGNGSLIGSENKEKDNKNKNKNKKKEKEKDEFHALRPLRGGGSRHSTNRQKHHASTTSYESAQSQQHRGACYTCLKTGLSCYNIIILLMGLTALSLGVWMMVKDLNAREITVLVGVNLYEVGACLMIAAGGIVALVAFCGCCGTMKGDRCVLGFYATVLCLMLIAIVSSATLIFIFKDYLSFKVKNHMREMVVEKYGVDTRNAESKLFTEAWDSMQREIGCCGAYGNVNSTYSWNLFKSTHWYRQTKDKVPLVPESCCRGPKIDLCTGTKYFQGPPWKGPPVPYSAGDQLNPHLFTEGCYDKLLQQLNQHILIIGVIAAAIPIFLLIGTVISFILCGMVRKDDTDDKLG